MDSKAGNWVFDPLTDVRGLDREKKILDSCFPFRALRFATCRRNDQRTIEWYMGTCYKSEGKEDGFQGRQLGI